MEHSWRAIGKFIKRQFEPATVVGDKKRARGKGEQDSDDEHLHNVNKTWREMLRDDPWRKKLMTHVQLLLCAMGIFFLMYWVSAMYFPAKHPIGSYVTALVLATIPYACWIGGWHRKVEEKVWAAFIKRFGKHFHKK